MMGSSLNIRTQDGRLKEEDPVLRRGYTGRPCLHNSTFAYAQRKGAELSTVSVEGKSLKTFEYIYSRSLKTMNTES